MKLLLITILCINLSFAQDAIIIKKGQKSPIDGVVITEKLAKELDKNDRLVLEYKELGKLNKELIEKQQQQIETLEKKETLNIFKNIGYFLLGAGVVALSVKVSK